MSAVIAGSKKLLAALVLMLLPIAAHAQSPLRVLPWNGYKAAVSLTFDDGLPIQLVVTLPELNKRNMRGTFFLCPDNLELVSSWEAALFNQEIGNHTNTHPHLTQIPEGDRILEVAGARAYLEKTFERTVSSFAYPFEDSSPEVESDVSRFSFMARGYSEILFITPASKIDWYSIGSQVARSTYGFETYKGWIDQDVQRHAWVNVQYHGFNNLGYEPVPQSVFEQTLDYLHGQESSIWVAPFGEVGAYLRGEQIFEGATVTRSNDELVYDWQLPEGFPKGVVLKTRLSGHGRVFKHLQEIKPDKNGIYLVPLDCGEIFLVREDRHEPHHETNSYARNRP